MIIRKLPIGLMLEVLSIIVPIVLVLSILATGLIAYRRYYKHDKKESIGRLIEGISFTLIYALFFVIFMYIDK